MQTAFQSPQSIVWRWPYILRLISPEYDPLRYTVCRSQKPESRLRGDKSIPGAFESLLNTFWQKVLKRKIFGGGRISGALRCRLNFPTSKIRNGRGTENLIMTFDLPNPSPLVDVNFVRVCRRIPADEVLRLADYELVWVWNVSIDSRNGARELRFWINSVVCPQMTARQTLNGVLCQLLPQSRPTLRGSEVGQLLLVGRDSVARLARILNAPLVNRTWHFKREMLFAWMKERYVGGMN